MRDKRKGEEKEGDIKGEQGRFPLSLWTVIFRERNKCGLDRNYYKIAAILMFL